VCYRSSVITAPIIINLLNASRDNHESLTQQLNDIAAAGSYTLQCGVDELRTAVNDAHFALFDADLKDQGQAEFAQRAGASRRFSARIRRELGCADRCAVRSVVAWQCVGLRVLLRNASDTLVCP